VAPVCRRCKVSGARQRTRAASVREVPRPVAAGLAHLVPNSFHRMAAPLSRGHQLPHQLRRGQGERERGEEEGQSNGKFEEEWWTIRRQEVTVTVVTCKWDLFISRLCSRRVLIA
jgi:hypothetical protein